MKFAAAVLTIPAFAILFAATEHPGPMFLLAMLLGGLAAAWRNRWMARDIDERLNSAPRRRPVFPFVALALLAGACRPDAETVVPEPVVALAEVETLDCGGRSCAVTEVAGATMITITE